MNIHYITIYIVTLLTAALIGCGDEENQKPATNSAKVNAPAAPQVEHHPVALFEYKLVSVEEKRHTAGPQIVLELETTNEVARNVTKEQLYEFWQQISPTLGDRRVFLYLQTPVPGAAPWALIKRIKMNGEWTLEITINEIGIDAEPYHFVNKIDRSALKQQAMIVTLPMVNRLNEKLVRLGWSVKVREEDHYRAESPEGIQSVSVTMTPESINIHSFRADVNTFSDTVDTVFADLGITMELKEKLYSVIGSPEYLRTAPGEPARWEWIIGNIKVTYFHVQQLDDLQAYYAR